MIINLGENLRTFRKNLQMTQEDLAERLNVSIGVISKWERGASEPELAVLVELADIFHVSVDVLLGYKMSSDDPERITETILTAISERKLTDAVNFAEEGLRKYPNSFKVVYQSARAYGLYCFNTKSENYYRRAIDCFYHAIDLLSQNSDSSISAVTISNKIAELMLMNEEDAKAIELLKQNNAGEINSDLIGFTLVKNRENVAEGEKYLSESFISCLSKMIRICFGFANAQYDFGDSRKAIEACEYLCRFLEICKNDPQKRAFFDKEAALAKTLCCAASIKLGQMERAKQFLTEARQIAKDFDADPVYTQQNVRFCSALKDTITAFDDLGETAEEAITGPLEEMEKEAAGITALWKSIDGKGK